MAHMKQAAGFLVAGAMVGAAVALFYAPQSGARTSRDFRKLARRTVNRLHNVQGSIREQMTDWVGDMTEVVKDGVGRVKELGREASASRR